MPLTVVHLLPGLDGGGSEIDTLRLIRAGLAHGIRAIVIAPPGRLDGELRALGIEHRPWSIGRKSPASLRWILPLRRLIAEAGIDILHAHSRWPAWLAWAAWRTLPARARPAFVTTVHGANHVSPYSQILVRGDRAIAVSRFVAEHLQRAYPGLPAERVVCIPRGIDPAAFPRGHRPDAAWREAFSADHPATAAAFRIVLAGRITRRKGHQDLVRIIAGLRQRGIPAHGIIVGGGDPRQERFVDLLREHGGGHLTFTGHRADLREIMAHAHAVVSLSHRPESFGLTVLEALALGVPVVGYAHGGVAELLRACHPVGAIPPGAIDAAVERLARIHAGTAPAPTVPDYTQQRATAATLALYAELAGARRAAR